MKPKNQSQNINPNISESSQNTASNSGTSSTAKGKEKEVINVVESLDLIIQNAEQLSVNISSESKADLNSEIEKNQLFWKKPPERKELAKKFSGLDRILYDKLEKKVGTKQPDTSGNVAAGCVFGVCGLIPGVSTVFTTPVLLREADERGQIIERSFSVDEVREIINDLGINNTVDISKNLTKIKNVVMENENAYETELTNLRNDKDTEIKSKDEEIERLKITAAQFIKEQQTREIKQAELLEQKQKAIKDKAELETINANYEKQLTKAKNQEEQIQAKNKAISDLIRLVNQKEQEKDILKSEWVILNTRIGAIEAEKVLLKNEVASKTRELQNTTTSKDRDIRQLQEKQLELRSKLNQAIDEAAEWEKKAKTAEHNLSDKDNTIRILRAEKEAAQPGFLKRQWNYCVANNSVCRWVNNTVNGFGKLIWITGLIVVLFVSSFVWKHVIKPIIKNFKGDKKEPTPTPTAAINQNQPPIIIMTSQPQAPNNYQSLPPQISAIEASSAEYNPLPAPTAEEQPEPTIKKIGKKRKKNKNRRKL